MGRDDSSTDLLLTLACKGEQRAADQLLSRYRGRLRRMVAFRIDPRLATRVDPSDVVQDALLEASRRLSEYARTRPVDFYPWLRQIAWDRLVDLHRRHVIAKRRTVTREESFEIGLNNTSVAALAEKLVASGSHPARRLLHDELCQRIRKALSALSEKDRELLLLRYVEQLSTAEIGSVLGVTEGTVKGRHRRALETMAELLNEDFPGEQA